MVVQPPETYNLLGLTNEEYFALLALLNWSNVGGPLQEVFNQMNALAVKNPSLLNMYSYMVLIGNGQFEIRLMKKP